MASFSIFNVKPIDRVIEKLLDISDSLVALMGIGGKTSWYREVHRQLKGYDSVSPPQLKLLYPVLLEMGIYADVQIKETSSNYVFSNETELENYWMQQMNLPEVDRPRLAALLRPHIHQRNGHVGVYKSSRTACIRIDRGRNFIRASKP
jgi:hypothetical protein